ncbi:hypothetical protein BJ508DRAFT_363977 [Ascobolus immersus RN42]|uniref:CBM1 domain-containing protein n=1 Tax=Ascobolus immersus RN42 TaxID=1160509 RepID=A0A3N4HYD4_ASCIM|nr:hypothetical protein BJ508DRAFT_363977 [Ascobolus immersus RN42]
MPSFTVLFSIAVAAFQLAPVQAAPKPASTTTLPPGGPWWQCGGVGFKGSTECVSGFYCAWYNAYESQCIPIGSTFPGVTPPATAAPIPTKAASTTTYSTTTSTVTSAPSPTGTLPPVGGYGQCGGKPWNGATTCVSGWWCAWYNEYESQCIPIGSTFPGVTPPATAQPIPTLPTSSTTPVVTPTPTPSLKPVPRWGQCGGVGYTGSIVCEEGSWCAWYNAYESQCLAIGDTHPGVTPPATAQPIPTLSSSTTTSAVTPTPTPSLKPVPRWGQCGGVGWTGSIECEAGSYCAWYNAYESQCLPIGSVFPGVTPPATAAPIPTLTTTTVKATTTVPTTTPKPEPTQVLWGNCGGKGWTGPFACPKGAVCHPWSDYESQCLPANWPGLPKTKTR